MAHDIARDISCFDRSQWQARLRGRPIAIDWACRHVPKITIYHHHIYNTFRVAMFIRFDFRIL